MPLIVILICFVIQWFFKFSSAPYQFPWASHYISRMRKMFSPLMQGHGMFAVFTLVLPLWIAASLLFTIAYHWLDHLGYALLSLALLWYCTDSRVLHTQHAHMSGDLFLTTYRKIFAPLAWYFMTGPLGLALYFIVTGLRAQLPDKHYLGLTMGVLDWVPLRILGLTFALAGDFVTVFTHWMKTLMSPLVDNQQEAAVLGKLALGSDHTEHHVMGLLYRTLCIWLIIMAAITLAVCY